MHLTIPILSSLSSLLTLAIAVPAAAPVKATHLVPRIRGSEWFNYTTIPGFFLQDDLSTNPSGFDYATTNLGLINRIYDTDDENRPDWTQWQKFEHYVWRLNRGSGRSVQYKVLYLGRHGEGYHNVAESYYGTELWNCYWSLVDGNGTSVWADARVTPNGIAQAEKANAFWANSIKTTKIPLPESYYTSPLTRCLQTANLTFASLPLPGGKPFIPTVKEFFREGISGHTCDRRSTKSYIQSSFPRYNIESSFTERDELFRPLFAEGFSNQDIRSKAVLDDVFDSDDSTFVSVTIHSGAINSLLRVLGHRPFRLETGQVIPVLVKAEVVLKDEPVRVETPWSRIETCALPPGATEPIPGL
ncbi:related to PMU1-high copy suppressor of ts tps2 mutant phenotype [Rhynchosporium agropyri]|uniref:Related to PMU1-high copy suppressor of ts tps2 mutant phenotype n=1 Tax=Rhynchosporium agropyri TaxID=914238 RepID=A0A1E1KE62_9HELO|nr:related to PMU1-high copy suppressor of ts tps2 mutant phenotype [Rhynchosporium agropyri]